MSKKVRRYGRALLVSLTGLALVLGLSSCSSIQATTLGLYYAQGDLDGDRFDHVVEPGSGGEMLFNDTIYQLPIDQRTYNACAGGEKQSCDGGEITVATKDQLVVDFAVASAFKLNTRTDDIKDFPGGTARKFLENICRKVNCVNSSDETDAAGWNTLLQERYRPALESAFKDVVREFNGDDLVYNKPVELADPADSTGSKKVTKPALEWVSLQVGPAFLKYLAGLSGGNYFCGPTFDRTTKVATEDPKYCPPIQLVVRGVDFNDTNVRQARQKVKIATDNAAAQKIEAEGAVAAQKAFGTPAEYVAYLNAQAALECAKRAEKCSLVVVSGDSGRIGVNTK